MSKFKLEYSSIRNLTPKGLRFEHSIYRGICPATSILDIPTDKNVRDAIEKSTLLRRQLRGSIVDAPSDFVYKNSGITILASGISVDDNSKTARLETPNIINGAQTQALCKWWKEEHDGETMPYVQFEIVLLQDEEMEKEISVARNSTHKVNVTSIYGYQGVFDELIKKIDTKFSIRETDPDGEDPLKLLQVVELLDEDWGKPWSTYSSKAGVLSRYAKLRETDSKRTKRIHALAPEAWKLYQHFRSHSAFEGCGLHANAGGVIRDKTGDFLYAADAIVFPILYAHRERVEKSKVKRLSQKLEKKIVANATDYFTNNAKSDVSTMGRKRGAYDDLRGRLEWLDA